ncbi:MAG: hypothetical protein IJZ25_04435 [Lachnospiraceae bacterium]|nr:hypothetical protein [Lachnospiraceae bacterium]
MTRIFVIKRKHLLFALIALIILVLIIVIGIINGKNNDSAQETLSPAYDETAGYVPGLYTGQIALGNYDTTLEILVDSTQVKNVRLINTDEAVETMYPLVGSTITSINDSLRSGSSIDELRADNQGSYTYTLLMDEIDLLLDKAGTN